MDKIKKVAEKTATFKSLALFKQVIYNQDRNNQRTLDGQLITNSV
jgi:hypothetical protein